MSDLKTGTPIMRIRKRGGYKEKNFFSLAAGHDYFFVLVQQGLWGFAQRLMPLGTIDCNQSVFTGVAAS